MGLFGNKKSEEEKEAEQKKQTEELLNNQEDEKKLEESSGRKHIERLIKEHAGDKFLILYDEQIEGKDLDILDELGWELIESTGNEYGDNQYFKKITIKRMGGE